MTNKELIDWVQKRFSKYYDENPHSIEFSLTNYSNDENFSYFNIRIGHSKDNGNFVFNINDYDKVNIHYRFNYDSVCMMFVVKENISFENTQKFIESLL